MNELFKPRSSQAEESICQYARYRLLLPRKSELIYPGKCNISKEWMKAFVPISITIVYDH